MCGRMRRTRQGRKHPAIMLQRNGRRGMPDPTKLTVKNPWHPQPRCSGMIMRDPGGQLSLAFSSAVVGSLGLAETVKSARSARLLNQHLSTLRQTALTACHASKSYQAHQSGIKRARRIGKSGQDEVGLPEILSAGIGSGNCYRRNSSPHRSHHAGRGILDGDGVFSARAETAQRRLEGLWIRLAILHIRPANYDVELIGSHRRIERHHSINIGLFGRGHKSALPSACLCHRHQ